MKTYKFRLKQTNLIALNRMGNSVNFVWNYCNQVSVEYLDKRNKWLSGFDLQPLTKDCSKLLKLHSKTIQLVGHEYATRRKQARRKKLSWRSSKRSLGWIPFSGQSVSVAEDTIFYNGLSFRFWNSRIIESEIKCGQFTQDGRGRWYVCFVCEVPKISPVKSGGSVGIDLGLKTIATLSDGIRLDRANITSTYADRLAMAQRARKKKRVKAIHAKIKNTRKDWNHKETTKIINRYDQVFVGNVSSSKLKKTRMAKSVSDAGWADFKRMLAYKAIALGVQYKEVNESFSTVTCSTCFERTGPSGLSALGVREWVCKCGAYHNRDVNAAKNILRIGCDALHKGGHEAVTNKY